MHPVFLMSHWSPSELVCTLCRLWPPTSMAHILPLNMVRHGTCWHNCTVDRRLVVIFCGQPHHCNRPSCMAARFDLPCQLSHVVCAELLPDWSRSTPCKYAQMGPCAKWAVCECGQQQITNHILSIRALINQAFSRESSASLNLVSGWAAHPVYNHSLMATRATHADTWP